jgi:hypothetical protein
MHAAAGIEDQAHSDGFILGGKGADGLLDFVIKHTKVILFQTGDRVIEFVIDGDRDQH